jgi:hypothetical protein
MPKRTASIITADEMRFKARTTAIRIAEARGCDTDVKRVIDTQFNHPCYLVNATKTSATVVYEYDPGAPYTIINRTGRLVTKQEPAS